MSDLLTSTIDRLASGDRLFSFEFFPAKTDAGERRLWQALRELEPLHPDFVSVTYGAGGSTRDRTVAMTERIATDTTLTPMAHLTCHGHTRAEIAGIVDDYRGAQVENLLALGGDPPKDAAEARPSDYAYATDLLEDLADTDFSIGVAAHPEVHPRSPSRSARRWRRR